MAKYFEFDARKGSFQDQTGRRTVTVNGSPKFNKSSKGLFNTSSRNDNIQYSSQIVPPNATTLVAFVKAPSKINTAIGYTMCASPSGSLPLFGFNAGSGLTKPIIYMGASNYRYFNYTWDDNWHCVIFTINGSSISDISNSSCYIDNVVLVPSDTDATGAQSSRATITTVGSCGSFNAYTDVVRTIYLATYDHIFTEQERAAAYKDFLNSYPQGKDKYACGCVKPMDLSREKESYRETDLMASASWYTTAYWNTLADPSWSQSGLTLISNGTGSLGRTSFWTLNKKYDVTVVVNVTSGSFKTPSDGNTIPLTITTSGTYNYQYTPTVNAGRMYIGGTLFVGTISSIVVREVTGLVAAYNMIPDGSTLTDISGNGNNLTVSKATSTKNGLAFQGSNAHAKTASATSFFYGSYTVKFIPRRLDTTYQYLVTNVSATFGTLAIALGGNTLGAYVYLGTWLGRTNSIVVKDGVPIIVTYTWNGTTATFYVNGINLGLGGFNAAILSTSELSIGKSGQTNHCEIQDVRVHNRILSDTEIKALHNSFVSPSLTEDFSTEGADGVAKVPSGWVKQSGSFKIDQINKLNNIWTNSGFDTNTNWSTTGSWTIANGVATSTGGNGTFFYQNAVFTPKKYKIQFTVTAYTSGSIQVGMQGGYVFGSPISAVGTYTVSFTPTASGWAGFKSILFVGSIDDVSLQEVSELSTINPGTKYLECVTAGTIAIPSKQAYGTWEFDVYKGADANTTIFGISNRTKIYALFFSAAERFVFSKYDGSYSEPVQSAVSYITINTWYRIRVTKTLNGVWTFLIKGGSFISTPGYDGWTLISTTSGVGSNPYTDNSISINDFIYLDIDAGDRIANINLLDGIKQL